MRWLMVPRLVKWPGSQRGQSEQPQQRDGPADREGRVMTDAAGPGRGVKDHAHEDRGKHDLHHERPPVPAGLDDRVVPAGGDVPEHALQEQGRADRSGGDSTP